MQNLIDIHTKMKRERRRQLEEQQRRNKSKYGIQDTNNGDLIYSGSTGSEYSSSYNYCSSDSSSSSGGCE